MNIIYSSYLYICIRSCKDSLYANFFPLCGNEQFNTHTPSFRRPVFAGPGRGQIVDRKRRYMHDCIIIIYILYCYRYSRMECECLSSSVFCSLNPFRVHPFYIETRSRCVTSTLADVLKTPRWAARNILYSTRKIDTEAKEKKKGFLCTYIVTDGLLFGSLYPYYFPQVIISYCACVCSAAATSTTKTKCRYGILFFDPRGCLQRKGVCDIRIYV
jgi:hypothetical protein